MKKSNESIMKEYATFSFGKNWQNFLRRINEDRVRNAELSITKFLGLKDLRDKSFIDIGCGSGLFSYASFNLGADKVVSFDVNNFSVECCKYLHNKINSPKNWEIYKGSILDNNFTSNLGKFDIVYAWGVLHHTGKMWESIKSSLRLVNKGGYYYIGIYNKVGGRRGSSYWLKIKKLYNFHPRIGRYIIEPLYIMNYFFRNIIRVKNPMKNIKNYKSMRGMNWRTDVTDWLGGYPYEFATVEEIFKFIKTNVPDINLINIKTTNGFGNNWYLFKRNEL